MRRILVIGVVAVCVSRAQPPVKTPAELVAELGSDLRGTPESPFPPESDPLLGRTPGPQRPTGESVSVARLRHKVPKQARKALERAMRFSDKGDHARAAEELESAILRDPGFADSYAQLGVEYGYLKRFGEAETALRHSLELDPDSWRAQYDLALILSQTGNFTEAEERVRRALRESSESPHAHMLLGYLLYQHAATRADGLQHLQYAARTLPVARDLLHGLTAR